jgi:hypothetical protein
MTAPLRNRRLARRAESRRSEVAFEFSQTLVNGALAARAGSATACDAIIGLVANGYLPGGGRHHNRCRRRVRGVSWSGDERLYRPVRAAGADAGDGDEYFGIGGHGGIGVARRRRRVDRRGLLGRWAVPADTGPRSRSTSPLPTVRTSPHSGPCRCRMPRQKENLTISSPACATGPPRPACASRSGPGRGWSRSPGMPHRPWLPAVQVPKRHIGRASSSRSRPWRARHR